MAQFVQKEGLPEQYSAMAQRWFLPLAEQLAGEITHQKIRVLGIVGGQGSGKSTLASLLKKLLEEEAQSKNIVLNIAVLSLDDFYLTLEERNQLAAKIHPLLGTRGVPGTHSLNLAINTIETLLDKNLAQNQYPIKIPRFNKAQDDRFPEGEWDLVNEAVDLIIFEGWCVSNLAQSEQELKAPINTLEREEDAEGIWRSYVNSCLANEYQALWKKIDKLIMLQIPSFDLVYQWRQRQEDKLIEKVQKNANSTNLKIMDNLSIERFIQHFERITRHNLVALPKVADVVFKLNDQQLIFEKVENPRAKTIKRWLVVSDLDGTLLDHFTYSHEPAKDMLTTLESYDIPVIINTSKTFAELIELREKLNNKHPFIVENGSAIYIPKNYFTSNTCQESSTQTIAALNDSTQDFEIICLGVERKLIQEWLATVQSQYPGQFQSYSDMGLEGIISTTGLSPEQAKLSNQRQFSEPLHWLGSDSEKQLFIANVKASGFCVLEGGRFLHIIGHSDKGLATQRIKEIYQEKHNCQYSVVAAGDGNNDTAMLEAADFAVLVKSPVHELPELSDEATCKIIDTGEVGPEGWSKAMKTLFNEQQLFTQ